MSISVILPFAGSCPGLKTAIESVVFSKAEDLELILVNDGGDALCSKVAADFAARYSFVKHVQHPGKGLPQALNYGISVSTGKYIARIDADDISLPARFHYQSAYLDERPEIGLVAGLAVYDGPYEDTEGFRNFVFQVNSIVTAEQIRNYRFIESPIIHPTVMFRRETYDQYGGYTSDPDVPEDYELWLRWLEQGVEMAKINESVIVWSDHPNRLSRTAPAYSKEAFDRVRMKYLIRWLEQNVDPFRPVLIWGAGKLGRRKSLALMHAGCNVTGFVDVDPSLTEIRLNDLIFPVYHYSNLSPSTGEFVISLVSNRGKPFEIEEFMIRKGWTEGEDFILAG